MKSSLTAADVLADIEFELVQGAISRDEIGQSIQLIRQHQNSIRSRAFAPDNGEIDAHELLGEQFKINDMLITLMQEMAFSMQEMQKKVDWVGQARRGGDTAVTAPHPTPANAETSAEDSLLRPTDPLMASMHLEAIHQKMQIQPISFPIPFLNGLVRRLRVALHNLVLFYVNSLAKKQAAVNYSLGDWILHLNALDRHQQEEVEQLMTKVQQMQSQQNDHWSTNE